jgi:hypothetical protein
MKYRSELLRADVEDELRRIGRLEEAFAQAEPKLYLLAVMDEDAV